MTLAKVKKNILLLVFFGLSALPATAESLEEFLLRVESHAAGVASFTCDFRQERTLAIFAKPVVFSGKLYLARPDRLRWEFRKPIASLLILDGKTGRRCGEGSPASEFNLERDPVMRLVAGQLRTWTGGNYRDLQGEFTLELKSGSALVLRPRQAGLASFLNRIEVAFDAKTFQPTRVEIHEEGGDRTVLSFTGYQLNPELSGELFSACRSKP
ncbi:MAG: outer membrane lipoprotein carrier protein LolA [Desulfobulbaceae bacterium]|nr:outer membrane lipoprotein carrier protein LolA [Desulfobulbaceae bacterium]